jgi:uncharacterized membrane protein (DUF4010 family)
MERGWERRDAPEGHRMAGFRTFGLIGLLGGVCTLPIPGMPSWLAPIMLVGLSLSVAVGYWRSSAAGDDISMTSAITALLTFALGGIAGTGELTVAAASAVVVTILLGFKPELHALLRKIDRNELEATFRLLLISVVVLPVLPNQTFGPWHALNLYRIWWMVVLVAGISYIGYFAARIIGPRADVLAAALFGGISSSTAVSVELSREAKDKPAARNLFAAGIIAASGMMFLRILAIVAIVASGLALPLAGPVAAAGLVSFAFAAAIWWIHRDSGGGRDRRPRGCRCDHTFGRDAVGTRRARSERCRRRDRDRRCGQHGRQDRYRGRARRRAARGLGGRSNARGARRRRRDDLLADAVSEKRFAIGEF